MSTLPTGTVTFVFTDIEGSTRLLQQLGDAYADVTRDHRRIVREAFGADGGSEVDTQGDAFFYSFGRARDAVRAAVAAQRDLAAHEWPDGATVLVRMGLHTGEPTVGDEGYLGLDVVRAARICSAGHGGQILLSETTRALLGNDLPEGASVVDLGEATLKDIQHEHVYQLSLDDGTRSFPPLKTEVEKDAGDLLGERIERHVTERIERALMATDGTGMPGTSGPGMRAAVGGCSIAVAVLVVALLALLALILLVKLAF
jgi:class 3 adenylate cyclase